ncbi:hypothetical protein [Chromobacterium violaceum]|uniref:hypothetical protein n=2 Tax=Chromobacterium violaceum TaxID=536 RepID=UPI0011C05579|nr:hypothetical protein [Chromobacterium violaceum]
MRGRLRASFFFVAECKRLMMLTLRMKSPMLAAAHASESAAEAEERRWICRAGDMKSGAWRHESHVSDKSVVKMHHFDANHSKFFASSERGGTRVFFSEKSNLSRRLGLLGARGGKVR